MTLVQALDESCSCGVSAAYFKGERGRTRAAQGPPVTNARSLLIFSPMFPVALHPPGLHASQFELGADERNVRC